jgi:hypothetical protein
MSDNRFKLNEEEKNRIRGLHNISEQSGFVESQGGSHSLDKFNKQQEMGEQEMSGLPTDGMPPVAPENETEISPEMTHDQFMDQLDGMCPEIIKQEKMVSTTNRSCGRCHTEEMALLRKYCLTRTK